MAQNIKRYLYIIIICLVLVALGGEAIFFILSGDEPDNPMKYYLPSASTNYDNEHIYEVLEVESTQYENDSNDSTDSNSESSPNTNNADAFNKNNPDSLNKTTINSDTVNTIATNPDTYTDDVIDNTSKQNTTDNSSDNKQHSDENQSKVYFSTSIIEGETVTKCEYKIQIFHNYPELKVEDTEIDVNGRLVKNFSGKVLLEEGTNRIGVTVYYRDINGREIVARKKYKVKVDINNLSINTTLKDMNVGSPYLEFVAYAVMAGSIPDMTVTVNGNVITEVGNPTDNMYSVTLAEGENEISLTATCDSYQVTQNYVINFVAATSPVFYTNLRDITVNEDNLDISITTVNTSSKATIRVTVEGQSISKYSTEKNGSRIYNLPLIAGSNKVIIQLSDKGNVSVTQTYTVRYVPIATAETEPKINYINIYDGMNIEGADFTLQIGAWDWEGNKIYYDGLEVKLNDRKISYKWSATYISYPLTLKEGYNSISIRVSDEVGRYKDYKYTVKCNHITAGTPIGNISFSVDAKVLNLGMIVNKPQVEIYYGDTVADVFERVMTESGYTYTFSGSSKRGFYLQEIAKQNMLAGWKIDDRLHKEIEEDGLLFNILPETGEYVYSMDSLGQLDFCQGSGWNYFVNGVCMEQGMSEYTVNDGDEIKVRYTLAYGKDIGVSSSQSGIYGIKDKYENIY